MQWQHFLRDLESRYKGGSLQDIKAKEMLRFGCATQRNASTVAGSQTHARVEMTSTTSQVCQTMAHL